MKMRYRIGITASALVIMAATGCGDRAVSWEMSSASQMLDRPQAPDWVRGLTPQSESRIYFVGRSDDAVTCLSERDAVQSARSDIHDQIRQRLAPSNLGTVGQVATMSTDSGSCLGCDATVDLVRTAVQKPCNSPCLHSSVSSPNDCVSRTYCGSCTPHSVNDGQPVEFVAPCGSCEGSHAFIAQRQADCASCPTLVHAVNADHRIGDYLPYDKGIGRDLYVFNVGIDSVMPALLSQLQEETVYLEQGATNAVVSTRRRVASASTSGHRAWLLCSIPRAEFQEITQEFRGRYMELYDMALGWSVEDRTRRIAMELLDRKTELGWMEVERQWNREDEIIARDHTITLDKDRHPLPGRRFSINGSR